MADYLATNTPRIRMTQTGPRGTHHMIFRVVPGTTAAAALSAVSPVVEAMLPLLTNGAGWSGAEFAPEGSDVFLPLDWTPIVGPENTENVDNSHKYGQYLNFVGRTTGGSRVAFYLFNVNNGTQTANNRASITEVPDIATVRTVFAANTAVLCGIDQNPFVLKTYANSGINDRVAKKSRSLA